MTTSPVRGKHLGLDKISPTTLMNTPPKVDVPMTPTGTQSIAQKYEIVSFNKTKCRIAHQIQLVKMVEQIMVVYMVHNDGHNRMRCQRWNPWSDKGITDPKISIHTLAAMIQFPRSDSKSVKAIGEFMLQKIRLYPEICRLIND